MTRRYRMPCLCLAIVLCTAGTLSQQAKAAINKVVIFGNGKAAIHASVPTRAAATSNDTLYTIQLPDALQLGSVRVAIPRGRLVSLKIEHKVTRQKQVSDKVRELRKQINKLEFKLRKMGARNTFSTFIRQITNNLITLPRDIREIPTPEQIQQLAHIKSKAALAATKRNHRMADIKDKIHRLRERIDQHQGRQQQPHRYYQLRLHMAKSLPDDTHFKIVYTVSPVVWRPTYRLGLDTQQQSLTIGRYIKIHQETGMDWEDVKLVLTTQQQANQPPVRRLNSWRIGLRDKIGTMRQSKAAFSVATQGMALDAARLNRPMTTRAPEIQARQTTFSMRYAIPNATVKGNSGWYKLPLATLRVPIKMTTRIKPARHTRPWVWVAATLNNDKVLPAGQAMLFRDGVLIDHQHTFEPWAPGETIRLAFGVDPRVTYEWELKTNRQGEDGLWGIGDNSKLKRNYSLTITNHHEQPWPVTLSYRIPVPTSDKIAVQPIGALTDWQASRKQPGVYTWHQVINGTIEMTLGYTLSWPSDRTLSGIDTP